MNLLHRRILFGVASGLLVLGNLLADSLSAAELTPEERDLFEIHVRPTLVAHCIKCHGEEKQESNLKLTTFDEMLSGGYTGPAVVPGKPEESLLLEAMRYESFEMPPNGQLEDPAVEGLAKWIKAGAPWPQGVVLKPAPKITEKDRDWWCYQPLSKPEVPDVDDNDWCRNPIDQFIYKRLQEEGLKPSTEAEAKTLARRLHFTLTGLPPGRETSEKIGQDEQWYENLIDRLLEQPTYGENQARFWLDLVRYADSDGYNADHGRPEAHHYRDYVIESFNEDKPYDRFVIEQLAGDEVDPGNREALVGTMYLRHWIYEYNQRDVEGQWANILNDITETTADVFLAQGLKCARCHDHKFDPLLQKDYFRMQAFFTPFQPREDLPIADLETQREYHRKYQEWADATAEIRKELHEIEHPALLKHAGGQGFGKFAPELQAMMRKRETERTPYEHQIASLAMRQLDFKPDKLSEQLEKEKDARRQELLNELSKFDHLKPEPLPTMKFVASDVGREAPPTTIPDVADAEPIAPGYPTILHEQPAEIEAPPEPLQSTGRRTALAEWITNPDNPLTARVMVNRIWQQHFGRGLVETSSDFGHLGKPPSHPELLDWLASRFIEEGWSIKKMHRLILTSATFRQTSKRPMSEELAKIDPANSLLWKMNSRRLSAEEIQDTLLRASGNEDRKDRAIYETVKRNRLHPLLASFDFPDRIQSQCVRHRTTTSPQALLMMNNELVHKRAQSMAADLRAHDLDSLVRSAYQRLYFREPTDQELALASEFFSSYQSMTPKPEQPDQTKPLPDGRKSITLNPDDPTEIQVPHFEGAGNGDLTVEATVLLRSLYPDASVRTIAAKWSGNHSQWGWALGVTSTKSAYDPRNLILQLIGSRGDGKAKYEVIASNLRVKLNTPYYVAVSVDLDDTSEKGVTFVLKDLSKPDEKPQIAHVAHHAKAQTENDEPFRVGGRTGHHYWDGLIHNVRVHKTALPVEQLTASTPAKQTPPENLLFDLTFAEPDNLGKDQSVHQRDARLVRKGAEQKSPEEQARIALLHAFLISNEAIYLD